MPAYINSPFVPAIQLMNGVSAYLFGSYNQHQANTRMLISNVALTTNVATITVQIIEGEIPLVGALISIIQTQASSGAFNVKRAAITGVTIDGTGAGTITFALTHADVVSIADTGTAIAEVPEIGETIVNGASIACCLDPQWNQRTIGIAITFPTLPTAASVSLQAALHNIDSEFTVVGSPLGVVAASAQTVGPFNQVTLQRGYFYRFITSGLSGSGKIVAKIGG